VNPTEAAIAEIRASKPLARHATRILELVRPHIRFLPRKGKAADNAPGATRLGGEPDLPLGVPWPMGGGFEGEAPMDFIAQIDLNAIALRDVDRVLPPTGVLLFFVAQDYSGGAVIHGEHDELVRVPVLGRIPPKRGGDKPPKWGGLDVVADMVLPPPWSAFISGSNRNATAWNARTNVTGKRDTLIELSPESHQAYCEIYDRWYEAVGDEGHGMLGYERAMEGVQEADEVALLRIDAHGFSEYDFVELVSIYWFITHENLVARKFDSIGVHCGSTI
jgi:uncharacterized protein YwqG